LKRWIVSSAGSMPFVRAKIVTMDLIMSAIFVPFTDMTNQIFVM
jgi:hypothetical protein